MRENKSLRIAGLFFLLCLTANLYVGYLWVSAWAGSRAAVVDGQETGGQETGGQETGGQEIGSQETGSQGAGGQEIAGLEPGEQGSASRASATLPSAGPPADGSPTQAAAGLATRSEAEASLTPSPGGIPDSGVESATPGAQSGAQEVLVALLPFLAGQQEPTLTPTPAATPTPEFPTHFPGPEELNGVALDEIVVLSEAAMRHAREIYASGLAQGRRPDAFSKIGDSTIETPLFLARFDEGPYVLGEYDYLQEVINQYAGSFARDSAAVRIGLHSWTAIDPMWADKAICNAGETPVACELRIHQPSLVIIRLGANDQVGGDYFRRHMEEILRYTIEQGVVPILSTRPDPGGWDENNQVVRALAEDFDVPLWDFARAAATLPGGGLEGDAVHMTSFYAHDYTLPEALRRGHGLQNLTALMALDRVWRVLEPGQGGEE